MKVRDEDNKKDEDDDETCGTSLVSFVREYTGGAVAPHFLRCGG